jgi:hypothetical protein
MLSKIVSRLGLSRENAAFSLFSKLHPLAKPVICRETMCLRMGRGASFQKASAIRSTTFCAPPSNRWGQPSVEQASLIAN